jgi:hypothetical protein
MYWNGISSQFSAKNRELKPGATEGSDRQSEASVKRLAEETLFIG